MRILNIFRSYRKNFFIQEDKLLHIKIDKKKLLNNIYKIKNVVGDRKIGAVLKSNAYGHGIVEMGTFLDNINYIDCFFVDSMAEAKVLKDVGVSKQIIILGYVPKKSVRLLKKLSNVTLMINSLSQAEQISVDVNFPISLHIKVDSGMHRQGVMLNNLERVIDILLSNPKIKLEGLASHFADADKYINKNTINQIKIWKRAVKIYKKKIGSGTFHFSATSGIQYINKMENNLVRVGAGIYGFDKTPNKILKVEPILSMFAKIVNIKEINKGEGVGYNFTFVSKDKMKIITLPCGYYEGVLYSLGNKGVVYYKGFELSIIGTVSMNIITVDATSFTENINIEDEVEIYSSDPSHRNSIKNVSDICEIIPSEVLCKLSPNIKRVIR